MTPAREILEEALAHEPESDARWELIAALHDRGDRETFDAAVALLDDADPARRAVAVDVLAQLGAKVGLPTAERPFVREAADLLLARIDDELHPEVLESLASAFGHLHDPRAIPKLRALSAHEDPEVRHAVAFGLLGHEDDLAIATLIELSRDPDADVRDWATFGLGAMVERDTPEIRAALTARLGDEHPDTRAEAVAGLEARGVAEQRAAHKSLADRPTNGA